MLQIGVKKEIQNKHNELIALKERNMNLESLVGKAEQDIEAICDELLVIANIFDSVCPFLINQSTLTVVAHSSA
jgi:hypothetical protein